MKKVYVVYRMYVSEYGDGVEMKVFNSEADARAYMETRKTQNGYYWDKIQAVVVE